VTVAGALGASAEPVKSATAVGVVVVSAGILSMAALASGVASRRALAFAAANAVVIAAYTVVDGRGARLSGAPASYTAWVFAATAVPLLAWAATARRGLLAHARAHWPRAVGGGALTFCAYALVLWAMTRAPVAAVAAVRETSVVFGTLLGAWRLREPLGASRLGAAVAVAAGVALLQR
jgi:drug/metabolite transporter (DMT)-like permease